MNKKLSIVLNIVKYILLFLVLLSVLIYGYGFIHNNYKTVEKKHEHAMGGVIMVIYYLPAMVVHYIKQIIN